MCRLLVRVGLCCFLLLVLLVVGEGVGVVGAVGVGRLVGGAGLELGVVEMGVDVARVEVVRVGEG